MSTTYALKGNNVVPYHGGRMDVDTRTWRDATDLELEQRQRITELENELAELSEYLVNQGIIRK